MKLVREPLYDARNDLRVYPCKSKSLEESSHCIFYVSICKINLVKESFDYSLKNCEKF
jgi:hypothetical protein